MPEQPVDNKAVKGRHFPSRAPGMEEHYDVRSLSRLPTPVLRELMERLRQGATAKDATAWLIAQPDRGPLQDLAPSTLLAYVESLAALLDYGRSGRGKHKPPPTNPEAAQAAIDKLPLPPL